MISPDTMAGRARVAELLAIQEDRIASAAKEVMAGAAPQIRQVVLHLVGSNFSRRYFPREREEPALLHPPYLDDSTREQLVNEIEERLLEKISLRQQDTDLLPLNETDPVKDEKVPTTIIEATDKNTGDMGNDRI